MVCRRTWQLDGGAYNPWTTMIVYLDHTSGSRNI
ncbi:hypothetical protein LSH36_1500g00003 [Paralvinella palmiformis]|uniref:Uncharacterized protein n=1 Tax=Paralvinella palmiformis TaxID=53620 RepID=A0AAD9ITI2_9ANNE|nr:hypothetical protein LSH36_1500g00003 [Paralvinella palmiformis]